MEGVGMVVAVVQERGGNLAIIIDGLGRHETAEIFNLDLFEWIIGECHVM